MASGGGFVQEGRYILKVVKLEKVPSQTEGYSDQIKWYFHLVDCTTGKRIDRDGVPYEWHQWSSVKISTHPKNLTRPWIEAFLDLKIADLADAEMSGLADRLLGAKAEAMLGIPTGKERLGILTIKPYREPAKTAQAAPVSAAVAVIEDDLPEAQRSGAVAVAAPDEDSFAF